MLLVKDALVIVLFPLLDSEIAPPLPPVVEFESKVTLAIASVPLAQIAPPQLAALVLSVNAEALAESEPPLSTRTPLLPPFLSVIPVSVSAPEPATCSNSAAPVPLAIPLIVVGPVIVSVVLTNGSTPIVPNWIVRSPENVTPVTPAPVAQSLNVCAASAMFCNAFRNVQPVGSVPLPLLGPAPSA